MIKSHRTFQLNRKQSISKHFLKISLICFRPFSLMTDEIDVGWKISILNGQILIFTSCFTKKSKTGKTIIY